MIRMRIFYQIIIFLTFCSFSYAGSNEHDDYNYKKLIIKKWFKSEKQFYTVMSWKFQGKYVNRLEELKLPFFQSLNINKMFVLDIANMDFVKKRKALIIDNKGQPHYIETEPECFKYIKEQYNPHKYGVDFIFDILIFIKYCNGYKFAFEQKYIPFCDFLNSNPELLKKSCKLEITNGGNKFLCQAYFSTMNGNGIILFEIELLPSSVKIIKKFEKIFLSFI